MFSGSVYLGKRNKIKNKQIGPNQTYKLFHSEEKHEQIKRQHMEREKISAYAIDKNSISKIYK